MCVVPLVTQPVARVVEDVQSMYLTPSVFAAPVSYTNIATLPQAARRE